MTWSRRRTFGIWACLVGVLGLTVGTGSASGAITLGETFAPQPNSCGGGYTRLQTRSPGDSYEAPLPGVITSFSYQSLDDPTPLKFKVGRAAGGDDYAVVGESGLVDPPANDLSTYNVNIPVAAGDVIGAYTAEDGDCGDFGAPAAFEDHFFVGDLAPGTPETLSAETNQLDLSAVLEPYRCGGRDVTIAGTAAKDTMVGTSRKDVIAGLEGKDKVKSKGGKDIVCGGEGRDKLKGGGGDDKLKGQKGADKLAGGGGEDTCVGGPGDDTAKKCEVERSL